MTGDDREGIRERRSALSAALLATGRADRAAFATVYRLTSARLFGICLRICSTRQAAAAALGEVYLTVWRRAAAFDPGRGSAITWLSTLARNRAIDWIRSNGRKFEPDTTIAELPSDDMPADAMMLDAENERRLHLCLDRLDDNQRTAIRTAFFDGCTYAQLAERQSIPLSTVKSWVRRGLMKLKDCLDADD